MIRSIINRICAALSRDAAEHAAGRRDALAGLPADRGQGFDYRQGYVAAWWAKRVR